MTSIRTGISKKTSALACAALALAALGSMVAARPARGASGTFYVSTGGNDSNPGTLGSPWRTVRKGIASLHAGETLFVRGGTYVERIDTVGYRAGSPGSPVLVKAYPGERPVIKGVLAIRNADYWTFDGINAVWDPANTPDDILVKIMDGVGWSFRNGEVWGAKSYAGIFVGSMTTGQPANWSIAGNCVHDTIGVHPPFQDHNLYLSGAKNAGPGLVERNIFFNAPNGNNIKVGAGSPSADGAGNITIRNNTMFNGSQNLLVAWKSHDILIERNIMGRATGKTWYPNLRGFTVDGAGNLARNNLGFQAASFLLNTDSATGIVDGGGNIFPRDPAFESTTSCAGFHATDPVARLYGRYGPSGLPLAGDWDGDGDAGPGLVRGNVWHLNDDLDSSADHVFGFGKITDTFVSGDWDGDGVETPGVVRGNAWYLLDGFGSGTLHTFAFGKIGDRAVVGDWDGNGTDTPGVVRGNVWYLVDGFGTGALHTFGYGLATDMPVTGDWNGDRTDGPGIVRGNLWALNDGFDGGAEHSFTYGSVGDVKVVGDWNGDGTDTPGAVRATDWFLRDTNDASSGAQAYSDLGW